MATFLKDDQNILVRDQNRFRKIYRYMRKKPRLLKCEGSEISHFTWVNYFVDFNYENEVSHVFPCCFEQTPAVIATTVSKTIAGSGAWTDADGATAATVSFYGRDNLSAAIPGTFNREFIHLKNADGSVDEIKFGSPPAIPSAAQTNYAGRTITRSLTVPISGGDTYQDVFQALQTALNADSSFKWEVHSIANVTGTSSDPIPNGSTRATFKLRSLTGNLGARSPISNPTTSLDFVDTLSIWNGDRYSNALSPGVDLFLFESPVDGTGQGSFSSTNVVTNPNFNVFVTDITKESCKFRTSGNFTGYVYYQALEDGAYTMPNIGKSLEVKTLQFSHNADFVTYTFTASFTCDPIVTVTADEDVNAFVTALSKTSVTVEVSKAGYQGKVYLQAIEKGC